MAHLNPYLSYYRPVNPPPPRTIYEIEAHQSFPRQIPELTFREPHQHPVSHPVPHPVPPPMPMTRPSYIAPNNDNSPISASSVSIDFLASKIMSAISPLLLEHQSTTSARLESLENSFQRAVQPLTTDLKNLEQRSKGDMDRIQELLRQTNVALQQSHRMQTKLAKSLVDRVSSLEDVIGRREDNSRAITLLQRLDSVSFTVEELLERARDPYAAYEVSPLMQKHDMPIFGTPEPSIRPVVRHEMGTSPIKGYQSPFVEPCGQSGQERFGRFDLLPAQHEVEIALTQDTSTTLSTAQTPDPSRRSTPESRGSHHENDESTVVGSELRSSILPGSQVDRSESRSPCQLTSAESTRINGARSSNSPSNDMTRTLVEQSLSPERKKSAIPSEQGEVPSSASTEDPASTSLPATSVSHPEGDETGDAPSSLNVLAPCLGFPSPAFDSPMADSLSVPTLPMATQPAETPSTQSSGEIFTTAAATDAEEDDVLPGRTSHVPSSRSPSPAFDSPMEDSPLVPSLATAVQPAETLSTQSNKETFTTAAVNDAEKDGALSRRTSHVPSSRSSSTALKLPMEGTQPLPSPSNAVQLADTTSMQPDKESITEAAAGGEEGDHDLSRFDLHVPSSRSASPAFSLPVKSQPTPTPTKVLQLSESSTTHSKNAISTEATSESQDVHMLGDSQNNKRSHSPARSFSSEEEENIVAQMTTDIEHSQIKQSPSQKEFSSASAPPNVFLSTSGSQLDKLGIIVPFSPVLGHSYSSYECKREALDNMSELSELTELSSVDTDIPPGENAGVAAIGSQWTAGEGVIDGDEGSKPPKRRKLTHHGSVKKEGEKGAGASASASTSASGNQKGQKVKGKVKVKRESAGKRRKLAGKSCVKWPVRVLDEDGNHGKFIQCDMCMLWYHCGCVGFANDDPRLGSVDAYTCPPCACGKPLPCPDMSEEKCSRPDCTAPRVENEFFVSRIIGRRTRVEGGIGKSYLWLIRWLNYPVSKSTWEAESSLGGDFRLIENFGDDLRAEGIEDNTAATLLLQEAVDGGWNADEPDAIPLDT